MKNALRVLAFALVAIVIVAIVAAWFDNRDLQRENELLRLESERVIKVLDDQISEIQREKKVALGRLDSVNREIINLRIHSNAIIKKFQSRDIDDYIAIPHDVKRDSLLSSLRAFDAACDRLNHSLEDYRDRQHSLQLGSGN